MNRYEALLILDIKGGEEAVKTAVERLEGEFKSAGATVETVQKMDRHHFSYVAGKVNSGFYANFIFQGAPEALEKLRAKLKLDPEVYRQSYHKLAAKKAAPAAA